MSRSTSITKILSAVFGGALILWAVSDDYYIGGGPGFGAMQGLVLAVGVVLVLSIFAPRKFASSLFTLFISTAITLLLAELVLRTVFSPNYFTAYEMDSRYHYKLIPGAERQYRHASVNSGETILYRVNEQGFRGNEISEDKNTKRIMVYGDSFIQAEFSALGNTFPQQLAQRIAQQGEKVEVINAGIAGYGPDQIAKKFADEAPRMKADMAIVSIFAGNDFGDLVRNKMYRLDEDGNIQENTYSINPEIERNMAIARHEIILKKILHRLKQATAGAGTQQAMSGTERVEQFRQQHIDEYRQYIIDGDNVVRELRSDPYSADISLTPESDSARYKVALMDGVIGDIQKTAAANNIPLLMLIIPHPMDLLNGKHDSGEVDTNKYPDYSPSRLTDTLQDIMVSKGIDFINLYESFRNMDVSSLYFKGGDDHWNDKGQSKAADIVFEHLKTGTEQMGTAK